MQSIKDKTHIIMEEGEPQKVVETTAAVSAAMRSAEFSSATGKPMGQKHMGITALMRAKFAERGITVDSLIDTFEEARNTARNRDGLPDHKIRMEAAKTEAVMMGLLGERKEEQQAPTTSATFTQAELSGKSNDEIVASVLRKLQIAQSKGTLSPEDVVVRPEQVESLSKFSQAAVGNNVESHISLRTRPGSKVKMMHLDFDIEETVTKAEVLADEVLNGNTDN